MWAEIFRFEINYHLRQPLFYISSLAFFVMALLVASTRMGLVLGDAPASGHINAPILIAKFMTVFGLIGLFVITAFVASSILRDFERGTHMLFFTKPVRKFDYLTGRFAGSMVISLLVLLVTALGMVAGRFVPWQPAESLGDFRLDAYLFAFVILVIPNLLAMGAILFAVASWSRRLLVAFLWVVFFVIVQDGIEEWAEGLENSFLGGVLEPTGLVALQTISRYWTAAEFNTALPDLTGALLINRLLWLSVGVLFLVVGYWRFSYSRAASPRGKRKRVKTAVQAPPGLRESARPIATTRTIQRFSGLTHWRQWFRQTGLETAQVLRGAPFIVILLLGVTFVITFAVFATQRDGMANYPVTYLMLQATRTSMQMFLTVIVIFYSGELIWRERSLDLAGVYDALPTPNWVFLTSKFSALVAIVAVCMAAGVISTILVQLFQGYTHLEPGLYLRGALITGYPFVLLAALAVFIQVLSPNKFLGYLIMLLVILARRGTLMLGLEHHLFRYGSLPRVAYSDMNGYGHYSDPYLWFGTYWGFAAVILIALSALLLVRGTETGFRTRLAMAQASLRGPGRVFLVVAIAAFAGSGAYIFYNTNILNDYLPRGERLRRMADYEKSYGQYRDAILPRVALVRSEIDLFPEERRAELRGSYTLVNESAEAIRVLPITVDDRIDPHDYLRSDSQITLDEIDLPAHRAVVTDERLGFYAYELEEELAPGDTLEMGFAVSAVNRGFKHDHPDDRLVANGTFFANKNLFPSLGYAKANQIYSPRTRQKYGLGPLIRTAGIDSLEARQRNYLNADWTRYETTISTRPDQIAIAPGRLEREWEEGSRRYFHYKTEAPVINLTVFVSGCFEVKRDQWDDVAIEVFYHRDHPYNIDRMIDATKKSLAYFSAEFGPYPHRQLRIVEVPNYIGHTAVSLAGTIPFSESWGFISRVPGSVTDVVTYVTAHEVAHQWWNHQVIPGDVQGATFISETLSQYSALMVMEKELDEANVRHFLKRELDLYLKYRGREILEEMPLLLVENQPYIHYNKGSLVMYALRDYVGEEPINRALARYIEDQAFQGPPYTVSLALLDYLRKAIPPEYEYLVEDLFETITLFDNRIAAATYRELEDGRYQVTIETRARKLRADGQGVETEIPIGDWIDIGIFGEADDGEQSVLYMEKRHITQAEQVFEIIVDDRPVRGGIDPYNKLVDRDSNDNVRSVSAAPSS
jgi:ABC-type transport system involved in multi-copper enzyme maturation permease subunit